jgi:hypothetical protein
MRGPAPRAAELAVARSYSAVIIDTLEKRKIVERSTTLRLSDSAHFHHSKSDNRVLHIQVHTCHPIRGKRGLAGPSSRDRTLTVVCSGPTIDKRLPPQMLSLLTPARERLFFHLQANRAQRESPVRRLASLKARAFAGLAPQNRCSPALYRLLDGVLANVVRREGKRPVGEPQVQIP